MEHIIIGILAILAVGGAVYAFLHGRIAAVEAAIGLGGITALKSAPAPAPSSVTINNHLNATPPAPPAPAPTASASPPVPQMADPNSPDSLTVGSQMAFYDANIANWLGVGMSIPSAVSFVKQIWAHAPEGTMLAGGVKLVGSTMKA